MLYILTGLPYSGKTILTQELIKRFGFSSVSMDDIMDQKNFHAETMTQTDWNSVYTEGYEKLKQLLSEGKNVILDMGNLKRHERDTARAIAQKLGVESKLIYLDLTVDEIEDRWTKNNQTQERDQLKRATLDRAFQMFEKPTPEENFIIYHQNLDLDKWIKETFFK